MDKSLFGPLQSLIGEWESKGFSGYNRAPDPDRNIEESKTRQKMTFEPIGNVKNHEQELFFLRYLNLVWEEGSSNDDHFHEEVGYFIWDPLKQQVYKSFCIPRGITVNAKAKADIESQEFKFLAEYGSNLYGINNNEFLDHEFRTISYELYLKTNESAGELYYKENTRLKILNQDKIFDHIEENRLHKVK